jgi:hypothetical protein
LNGSSVDQHKALRTTGEFHRGTAPLVRASQIGGDRDRRPLTVFDAAVWILIYLKPSSDWRLKPVTGRYLNTKTAPFPFGDRSE